MQTCWLKIGSTHIHTRWTLQRLTTHNHNCTQKVDASRLANLKLVWKKNPKTQLLIHALLVDYLLWALNANSYRSYIFPSHNDRHFRGVGWKFESHLWGLHQPGFTLAWHSKALPGSKPNCNFAYNTTLTFGNYLCVTSNALRLDRSYTATSSWSVA